MAREIAREDSRVLGSCLDLSGNLAPEGCIRVVGVAANQRTRLLDPEVEPAIFLSRAQMTRPNAMGGPVLLVRTQGDPADLSGPVRSALQGLAPDLAYMEVQPLAERVRGEVLPLRVGATLFSLFGLLALLLTGAGLTGVLAYFVGERTGELAVRRALGAVDGDLIRMVVRQSLIPVGLGLVVGLIGAWYGARLLESHLFAVSGHDPSVYGAVVAFVFLASLLASYLPARWATRVDAAASLRSE